MEDDPDLSVIFSSSLPRLASTSVVVVTADAIMGEQVRDQADFVLIKPTSFAQLRDLTARLLPPK